MVPDGAAGAPVEREHVVCRSHEHYPIDNHRSDLEMIGIAGMKYPLRAQLPDIAGSDLR